MSYEEVKFSDVRSEIERILSVESSNTEWVLLPDTIFALAQRADLDTSWNRVPGWASFESGPEGFDLQLFLNLTCPNLTASEHIIFVTDECFFSKLAYRVCANEIMQFMAEEYPSIHNMCFIQPLDTIVVSPDTNALGILHHEGYSCTIHAKTIV